MLLTRAGAGAAARNHECKIITRNDTRNTLNCFEIPKIPHLMPNTQFPALAVPRAKSGSRTNTLSAGRD